MIKFIRKNQDYINFVIGMALFVLVCNDQWTAPVANFLVELMP
jgi:hypothetical protein